MIIDDADPTLRTPVLLLACSRAVRMRTVRRNGVPGGARMVAGGVALAGGDEALGWLAYGSSAGELEIPYWPARTAPQALESAFPGSVEVVVVATGRDPRRAAGAVNAQLLRAGAKPAETVDTARLDETWRTVAQQRAAERYRRMQWLFNHVQLGGALDA